MTEWQVVTLIGGILAFMVGTVFPIVRPLIKLNSVMQKNTDAIDSLTKEIKELTINNKEDHNHFFKSINHLKSDVELLKQKHDSDIELLKITGKEN